MSAENLTKAVDRLLAQVSHWEQARWTAGTPTRGELVHGLAQQLADLSADAEGRAHQPVPRVGDLVLRDQIRVISDDLLAATSADQANAAPARDLSAGGAEPVLARAFEAGPEGLPADAAERLLNRATEAVIATRRAI